MTLRRSLGEDGRIQIEHKSLYYTLRIRADPTSSCGADIAQQRPVWATESRCSLEPEQATEGIFTTPGESSGPK